MRETFQTVEVLYARLLNYMLESGRQMDEGLEFTDEMQAEISTAFLSIFPPAGCLFWMELPAAEKERQTVEMGFIVQGIRIFNKYSRKGGGSFQLPFEDYKVETKCLSEKIMDLMQSLSEKAKLCAEAISLHLYSLGLDHVIIQRLRDELTYHLQAFAILEDFQCFLEERFGIVTEMMDESLEHLNALSETVGSRPRIANELVFPKFEAVGRLHKAILEQLRMLRAHDKSSVPLLSMIEKPHFLCTPTGIANLCSQTAKVKSYYSDWQSTPMGLTKLNVLITYTNYLPREVYIVGWDDTETILREAPADKKQGFIMDQERVNDAFELGKGVHLGGYCPVTLTKHRGLLWHGDPEIGLVNFEDKLYAFSTDYELGLFAKAPGAYVQAIKNVVTKMPQLIHILRLENEPDFSTLKISEFIDVVNEPLPCEFGTQTSTHIIPPYRWTDETFYKRALQLANKSTESSQTPCTHFRRSSSTQVWLPKEKWTQTRFNKGTKMTHHVRHFHGLQGPPTVKFKMLRTKYDV